MLFNTVTYLFFLPLVFILYYEIPHRFRWVLLLLTSYTFYMWWKPEYIILIVFSTFLDFFLAKKIHQSENQKRRKLFLVMSLLGNLGVLVGFKYFNFITQNLNMLSFEFGHELGLPVLDILLPVGISFYTFQTMSYSIDVYSRKIEPETHFGRFAVFVSFFPQLVAGPIERAGNLLPQFAKKIEFNYYHIVSGLRRILWGLFKKVVIADRVAVLVNHIYNNPEEQNGLTLTLATYLFAFQIYCDFSGYSDIAIGSARLLGIDLMENFKLPYRAKSIGEFWQRWHISLSNWFRDYVYIPLGGNRVRKWRWYYNLMFVFVISGFWHGSKWTFIVWGALHGFYLVMERVFKVADKKKEYTGLSAILRIFVIFNLVVFAWLFFRANSMHDAVLILQKIADVSTWHFDITLLSESIGGIPTTTLPKLLTTLGLLVIFIGLDAFWLNRKIKDRFLRKRRWFKWSTYLAVIFIIVFLGFSGTVDFIYFQF
jgi:alginate O-acetyltransferase complex protein AlgI